MKSYGLHSELDNDFRFRWTIFRLFPANRFR
jgi:hypothetical protein